jgi:hypothetical protein
MCIVGFVAKACVWVHGPWDIFLLTKKKVLKFLEAAWEPGTRDPQEEKVGFKTSKLEQAGIKMSPSSHSRSESGLLEFF